MLADALDQVVNGLLLSQVLGLCESLLNGIPMSLECHFFEGLWGDRRLFMVWHRSILGVGGGGLGKWLCGVCYNVAYPKKSCLSR